MSRNQKSRPEHETVSGIARRRGCTYQAVERAIVRTGTKPTAVFGTTRVYGCSAVATIEAELDRLKARKARRGQAAGAGV